MTEVQIITQNGPKYHILYYVVLQADAGFILQQQLDDFGMVFYSGFMKSCVMVLQASNRQTFMTNSSCNAIDSLGTKPNPHYTLNTRHC